MDTFQNPHHTSHTVLAFTAARTTYSLAVNNVLQFIITRQQIEKDRRLVQLTELSHIVDDGAHLSTKMYALKRMYTGSLMRMGFMLANNYVAGSLITYTEPSYNLLSHAGLSLGAGCISALLSPMDALVTHKIKSLEDIQKHSPLSKPESYASILQKKQSRLYQASLLHGAGYSISWFFYLSTLPYYLDYKKTSPHAKWQDMMGYAGLLAGCDMIFYAPMANIKRVIQTHETFKLNMRTASRILYRAHGVKGFYRGAPVMGISCFLSSLFNISYLHLIYPSIR